MNKYILVSSGFHRSLFKGNVEEIDPNYVKWFQAFEMCNYDFLTTDTFIKILSIKGGFHISRQYEAVPESNRGTLKRMYQYMNLLDMY